MSQIIPTLLSSTADLITYGLTPFPYLRFSVFDLIGSVRLALVLRQIKESERQRGIQEKQRGINSKETREIEDGGLVKDLITVWTVVYGGEMVCGMGRSSLLVPCFLHCVTCELALIFLWTPDSAMAALHTLLPHHTVLRPSLRWGASASQPLTLCTTHGPANRIPIRVL
jgi:hypothetical protein